MFRPLEKIEARLDLIFSTSSFVTPDPWVLLCSCDVMSGEGSAFNWLTCLITCVKQKLNGIYHFKCKYKHLVIVTLHYKTKVADQIFFTPKF